LPELGKGIGEGFRALKDSMKDKPEEPSAPPTVAAPSSTEIKS
jgi:Sec-independent protein translocase protein TatA